MSSELRALIIMIVSSELPRRFQSERKRKEIQLRTQVNQRLEESGERER